MDLLSTALKGFRSVMKTSGRKAAPLAEEKSAFDYLPSPKGGCFCAGFSKESILPPDAYKKSYFIAGYQGNKKSTGVLDEPCTHAVWLDDLSGRGGIVLVSIDDVGMLKNDVNIIRSRLHDFAIRTGCRSINVVSTHNHAGIDTMGIWGPLPLSGKDKGFMEHLFSQTVKAVEQAYANRKNGSLYLGRTEVPDMQEDIRLPVVYSKTLTRLRFEPSDGSRQFCIVNFASHSESLQGCNKLISADFPCYLRERIAEEADMDTLYCVGCIGGMISMEIKDEKEIRDNGSDFAPSTKAIGRKLGGYALSISKEEKLSPSINLIRREFYLEADNTVLMLAAKIGILNVTEYHDASCAISHALKTEMSYIEIGSLKVVLLPGELFPELAYGGYLAADESGTGLPPDVNPAPLTEILGDRDTMFIGLANDEVGYIIPPNDFVLNEKSPYAENGRDALGRRHYEETNSIGPKTAPKIAETLSDMMKQVEKAKVL